jgi:hypothetical protein
MREPVLSRPHEQERVRSAQDRAWWRRSQWQAQVLQLAWSPPVSKHRVRFSISFTPALTHPLLHSLTHSLSSTHSLTHSLTHSFTPSRTHSLAAASVAFVLLSNVLLFLHSSGVEWRCWWWLRCACSCGGTRLWSRDYAAAMNIAANLRHFLLHARWHPDFFISSQDMKERHR